MIRRQTDRQTDRLIVSKPSLLHVLQSSEGSQKHIQQIFPGARHSQRRTDRQTRTPSDTKRDRQTDRQTVTDPPVTASCTAVETSLARGQALTQQTGRQTDHQNTRMRNRLTVSDPPVLAGAKPSQRRTDKQITKYQKTHTN